MLHLRPGVERIRAAGGVQVDGASIAEEIFLK